MSFSLEELTKPLTVDEVKTRIYDAIAAAGVDTTTWKPGAVVRTIIAGTSIALSAFSEMQAEIAKQGFLDLAEGPWLKLKAKHDYGVEANEGTFATGEVQLDNTAGGVYSVGVGEMTVQNSTSGKTYVNTEAFSIGALETGVLVDVRAVEIGTPSNAAPGEIDSFVTPLLGVTVTNPAAVVGSDAETDAQIRRRSRDKTGSLSPNGPADAYRFIAASAVRDDGTSIGATRVNPVPLGAGGVVVYVADASGTVDGDPNDSSTDLGIIQDDIAEQAEPLGITANVLSATAVGFNVTYEIWVSKSAGLTDSDIESAVSDALTEFYAAQPIGGTKLPGDSKGKVFVSAVRDAIFSAVDGVVRLELTSPTADIELNPHWAPVLGGLSATVTQIGGVS